MAKRKRTQNIEARIKDGRGIGVGENYKPWIKIQDVPSRGRVTRLKGIKTNRQHEFLSDMERNYFYLLEFSDDVVDIREQYPLLPIEDTMDIASELGIEHAKDPVSGELIVMTTDFLITINSNSNFINVARTIKLKKDLLDRRVIEKFEIERRYWEKRKIDWGIVTEQEIDKVVSHNISFVQGYKNMQNIDGFREMDIAEIKDLTYEFIKRLVGDERSVRAICLEFDNDMLLPSGSGISIFKYLIINKIIIINILEKIDINKHIEFEHIQEKNIRKVESI